jgi:hypothetical protein
MPGAAASFAARRNERAPRRTTGGSIHRFSTPSEDIMAASIRGEGERRVRLIPPAQPRTGSPVRIRRVDPATIPPGTPIDLAHPIELQAVR